jgi:hypothetical protein
MGRAGWQQKPGGHTLCSQVSRISHLRLATCCWHHLPPRMPPPMFHYSLEHDVAKQVHAHNGIHKHEQEQHCETRQG